MDMNQAVAVMRARSDELKAAGPGRVDVASIHNINEVKVRRACEAALTGAEKSQIRQAIAELQSHLTGIEVAVAPPTESPKKRGLRLLSGSIAGVLGAIASGASKAGRESEQWQQMTTAAGGPAQLPPPKDLLDAAEAWLIATATEGRVDVDRSVLARPWIEASVTAAS